MYKKSNIIVYILCIISIIPFYYITSKIDLFNFVLSLSITIIFLNCLSHISIFTPVNKYYNACYFYTKEKIFKSTIRITIILNIIFLIIMYILGIFIENILEIKNLIPVLLTVGASLFFISIIRILKEYMIIHNYKKLGNNLQNIYIMGSTILLNIIGLIVNNIKINNTLKLVILSSSFLIVGLLIIIYSYLKVLKNKKKLFRKEAQKREEYKINYHSEIKKIFTENIYISLINIIKYSFYYLSIIISYKVIFSRYNYSYTDASKIIVNTYFYSLLLIMLVFIIFNYKNNRIIEDLKNKLILKDDELNKKISKFFFQKIDIYLPFCLILLLLSNPLWGIIFNNYKYSYTLGIMNIYLLFLILYNITIKLLEGFKNKKVVFYTMLSGLIFFLIIIIPLIDTTYRLGYPLIIGSITSLILSYLFSIFVGGIYLKKKYNVLIINDLEKILNIIYKNIILAIILIVLQLIVPIKIDNQIKALLLIFFYFISGIIAYIIINLIRKKNKKI